MSLTPPSARRRTRVHLSQAYTLLGRTADAFREQQSALALTTSASVMTRALLALDEAACRRIEGDHDAAADPAARVWTDLPVLHRSGLVRSRATVLQLALAGRAADHLAQALAA
ncbi:hypothetical protein ACFYUY_23670 [Kitasatospora sp. NPDC004745]|uniref:hypothetical protein n=1 Tax=Kitasatospora sp. NPDC004745 TaxID=3364019 RepID=UPI0036AB2716